MKKILKFCSLFTIALTLTFSFVSPVKAAENDACNGQEGCRVGERGAILVSEVGHRALKSSTPNTRNKYARYYWEDTPERPYNHYLHPYSDINIATIYDGVVTQTYGFNVYYDAYSALYCLDGNLEGGASLYAERFLVDGDYNKTVQAHDYALMSILTNGSNDYTDVATYWAKLIAIRAITITFNLDKTNLGGSSAYNQYAIYGTLNQWLSQDSTDYDRIASYVSVKSKGQFAAYSDWYYSGTVSSPIETARNLYYQALSVAADFLETGEVGENFKENVSSMQSDRKVVTDGNGDLVLFDSYHEFTIGHFTENDTFTIDNIELEEEYEGLRESYISKIELNGQVLADGKDAVEALLGQNLIEAFPDIPWDQELELVVTVHFEGYEKVNTGSSIEPLNCLQQPLKYKLNGTYSSSLGGAYSNYVATVWYVGTGNTQRYIGIEEGTSNLQEWSSEKEITLTEDCPGQCDILLEECQNNPGSDACDEYDALCDATCTTTVENFECCDANNNLIIATTDNHPVNIKGPQNAEVCFVEKIDAQVDQEGNASGVEGTKDDEGNTYKLDQNRYCVVSCKEDYMMEMPTAKLVNAGRYFTFSAAVEGTKTCYTNTIDRDLYNEDMIKIQIEMLEAYDEYKNHERALQVIGNWEEVERSYPTTASPGICSCGYGGYETWIAYTTTHEYHYTGINLDNLRINYDTGIVGYSYQTKSNEQSGSSKIPGRPAGRTTGRSCTPNPVTGGCTGGCEPTSCTVYRLEKEYTISDLRADITERLNAARKRLETAQEEYQRIIDEYNDCSEWNEWDPEIVYDPEVYYDYEEDYIADFYNNYGQMDANISNTNESDWFCNSSVTTGTGNETQATLSGTAYNSCSGNVSSGVSYTSINYTYCDTTSCGNTKPESVQQISNARYKKHTSTVDATYVPSTLFYNVYPSGEITDTPADDNVALENSLPVSLSTKRGIYEYSIKLDNLGEYYDSGNTGRLIGGSNAVINRQDYAEFFDENGEVQYVCAYLVNMGKEEDYTIVCDWDQCQDGDCTVNCVGPGCDDVCDGNDCIASCIGAGCIYDVDAGSSLIERVVSLSNLFPNGTDSYNWNRDLNEKAEVTIDEIEEVGNSIYDEEPILSVTLTPGATRAIRAYNDEAERYNRGGYSNSTLSCYALDGYEEIACYSSFITNLINGNVSYGDETYATGLDIIGDRSLIMGNNYRTVSDDNFRYFTIWNSGISEDDMIGPSWK